MQRLICWVDLKWFWCPATKLHLCPLAYKATFMLIGWSSILILMEVWLGTNCYHTSVACFPAVDPKSLGTEPIKFPKYLCTYVPDQAARLYCIQVCLLMVQYCNLTCTYTYVYMHITLKYLDEWSPTSKTAEACKLGVFGTIQLAN